MRRCGWQLRRHGKCEVGVPVDRVRVVIDANVFVSAAIGRGASTRLIDQWMSGQASYELIVCPRLIDEVRDVLDRRRFRKRISAEDASVFVEAISMLPNQVPDPSEIAVVTRDADDDYLVALAKEHEAVWIVTGDDDLLEWEEQSPRTIAPAAFEQWLIERS
jgi:uncharacterized protein